MQNVQPEILQVCVVGLARLTDFIMDLMVTNDWLIFAHTIGLQMSYTNEFFHQHVA